MKEAVTTKQNILCVHFVRTQNCTSVQLTKWVLMAKYIRRQHILNFGIQSVLLQIS